MVQQTAMDRVGEIAAALAVFVRPGQVTELRVWTGLAKDGRPIFVSRGAFTHDTLYDMAERALEAEKQGAHGCYFVPNPLRGDFAESRKSAADADVIARHWLLIDVDPIHPEGAPKQPSDDTGRAAARRVLDRCIDTLECAGFAGRVVGDSGNGWHVCYPIDYPNDDATKVKVKALLQGLKSRCGDQFARVDHTTYNAARIWPVYGTLKKKGQESEGRCYRRSQLVEGGAL